MKIVLVRLQILFILLIVFSPLLFLGYKHFLPQIALIKYDFAQKRVTYPPISPLHTSGINILNDHNEQVILRGVNLISTNWEEKYSSWNPQAINIAAEEWHVNVIRSRIYEHEFETNQANFFLSLEKQILKPARQHGLYIILHPWFGENESLPDKNGTQMWLAVAKRYKNDPHIIFDLLAEPRDITFSELTKFYNSLIPQIRSISPQSLIMVTGLDWGRDINAWLDTPLPFDNLVYRSNPYNKTSEFPGYFGRIAETYPVFLGEFGTEDELSMTLKDVENLLGYANSANLSWTAWHFTSIGCPCLLTDENNFTPSPYGQLIKNTLAGNIIPFILPTFNNDPTRLYVYSDFLESGFADYSWGITNKLSTSISTNFHPSSGLYFNTSRRLNPKDYQSFVFTINTKNPTNFTLRFKSFDESLSANFPIINGENIITTNLIELESVSGIILEPLSNIPDPTPAILDNLYFQK